MRGDLRLYRTSYRNPKTCFSPNGGGALRPETARYQKNAALKTPTRSTQRRVTTWIRRGGGKQHTVASDSGPRSLLSMVGKHRGTLAWNPLDDRRRLFLHAVARNDDLNDILFGRDFIHWADQNAFQNRAQTARADVLLHRRLGHRPNRVFLKRKLNVFHLKNVDILPCERVFRLGQDAYQSLFVKLGQRNNDRQTPDQLRDQAKFDDIVRFDLFENRRCVALLFRCNLRVEAYVLNIDALLDDLVDPVESAAADKENIGRIDLNKFLLRVLAARPAAGHWRSSLPAVSAAPAGRLHR